MSIQLQEKRSGQERGMANETDRQGSNSKRKTPAITYHRTEQKIIVEIATVFRVPLDQAPEVTRSFEKWAEQWE
jgi:hypothetical protein